MEPEPPSDPIIHILHAARDGNPGALAELFDHVYQRLHALAKRQRLRWSGNLTLDTTALLHESFLKLVDRTRFQPRDLQHFYAVAARAMRQILLDYAQLRRASKRGSGAVALALEDADAVVAASQEELVAIVEAMDHLKAIDGRRASVFEFRFFLGMSVAETATLLEVSPATVKRDWALATAFLQLHVGVEDGT